MADWGSSHVSISVVHGVHSLLWNQTHTSNLPGISQTTHAAFSSECLELNERGMSWPHKLVYLLNRDQEALKPRSVGLDTLSADSKDRLAQTVSGIHGQEDIIVMSSSDCHSSSLHASGGHISRHLVQAQTYTQASTPPSVWSACLNSDAIDVQPSSSSTVAPHCPHTAKLIGEREDQLLSATHFIQWNKSTCTPCAVWAGDRKSYIQAGRFIGWVWWKLRRRTEFNDFPHYLSFKKLISRPFSVTMNQLNTNVACRDQKGDFKSCVLIWIINQLWMWLGCKNMRQIIETTSLCTRQQTNSQAEGRCWRVPGGRLGLCLETSGSGSSSCTPA